MKTFISTLSIIGAFVILFPGTAEARSAYCPNRVCHHYDDDSFCDNWTCYGNYGYGHYYNDYYKGYGNYGGYYNNGYYGHGYGYVPPRRYVGLPLRHVYPARYNRSYRYLPGYRYDW